MRLDAPDPHSKRARLADWLELEALASSRQSAPLLSIGKILRLVSDDRTIPTDLADGADDEGDPEVTDRATEDLLERVVEEIEFRLKTIGTAYPFEWQLSGSGQPIALKAKATAREAGTGELVYTFCLLDSCFREGMIKPGNPADRNLVQQIGAVFQICSCLAVGGYTDAEVVSFGFPRATGNAFLPALQQAWQRYGSYEIIDQIPHGFDASLQDGGVDIIAWLSFPDGHAATLIMFAQVASGLGWKDKSVVTDVAGIKQWFKGTRFEHYVPAICIPFPLWFDLEEPAKDDADRPVAFAPGVMRRFEFREPKFGIIFDRGRIARCSALGLTRPPAQVDGVNQAGEISNWVDAVLTALSTPAAAAA